MEKSRRLRSQILASVCVSSEFYERKNIFLTFSFASSERKTFSRFSTTMATPSYALLEFCNFTRQRDIADSLFLRFGTENELSRRIDFSLKAFSSFLTTNNFEPTNSTTE
jgi:hypothetical protein